MFDFPKIKILTKRILVLPFQKMEKKVNTQGTISIWNQKKKTILASGIWHPQPTVLKSIRNEIAFNLDQYEKIINEKKFIYTFGKVSGNKLVRPPKGFNKEHPAVEYLKHKDFVVTHEIEDIEVCSDDFKSYCIDKFKIVKPFSDFFHGPVFDVIAKEG